MSETQHKAGFVSIVGKPNVGKSTLMNQLVEENLSIITSKAQTTRHRIQGIISGEDFQIVYSDTPGIIKPQYKLHEFMMNFVSESLEDADVILFVTDIFEKHDEGEVVARLARMETPIIVLVNKIDLVKDQSEVEKKIDYWNNILSPKEIIPISALEKFNLERIILSIKEMLPEHPAYYPKDQLTTLPERFFASEIIREKILRTYKKEVPYSCDVIISVFKDEGKIIHICGDILVERDSQKGILIGKGGAALKKIGTEARKDMEEFFKTKVFLELFVKVESDWRKKENKLKQLGYIR